MTYNPQKEWALDLCSKAAKVLGYHANDINQEIKDVALLIIEEKRESLFPLDDNYSNKVYRNLQKVKREIEKQ